MVARMCYRNMTMGLSSGKLPCFKLFFFVVGGYRAEDSLNTILIISLG